MRLLTVNTVWSIVLAACLGGCGTKGQLVLPPPVQQQSVQLAHADSVADANTRLGRY